MRSIVLALAFTTFYAAFQTAPVMVITDNPELNQMYTVDESEREGANVDWTALYRHDIERRSHLQRLLEDGKVQTAADYFHAAMIYQHGQTPDDYLRAHLLAVTAISKGSKDARWLTAATMDRYLRSIWQPQVYGTQFLRSSDKEPWSHELMNEKLLSESMRAALCVVPLAKQKEDLAKIGSNAHAGTNQYGALRLKQEHEELDVQTYTRSEVEPGWLPPMPLLNGIVGNAAAN